MPATAGQPTNTRDETANGTGLRPGAWADRSSTHNTDSADRCARTERKSTVNNQNFAAPSRRVVLQGIGGLAAASVIVRSADTAAAADSDASGGGVHVSIGGRPAKVGSYAFPGETSPSSSSTTAWCKSRSARDDVGVLTGWSDVSITATSVIVAGTELAHNLNGVEPRDPDRQHSFYVDAGGGRTRLVCSRVDVLRIEPKPRRGRLRRHDQHPAAPRAPPGHAGRTPGDLRLRHHDGGRRTPRSTRCG